MRDKLKENVTREIRATDSEVSAFVNQLSGFLSRNITRIMRGLERRDIDALEAAATLGGLESALQAAGVEEEIERINILYANQIERIRDKFDLIGKGEKLYTDADIELAETLIDFDSDVYKTDLYTRIGRAKADVFSTILGGQQPDVREVASTIGDYTTGQYQTEINSRLGWFSQAMTNKKAADIDIGLWIYLGPDDNVTRPFCAKHVGKIVTTKERAGLTNDAKQPADVYLGGFNCRHQWAPLSERLAKEYGYDN
jgi:hypothetical protein